MRITLRRSNDFPTKQTSKNKKSFKIHNFTPFLMPKRGVPFSASGASSKEIFVLYFVYHLVDSRSHIPLTCVSRFSSTRPNLYCLN